MHPYYSTPIHPWQSFNPIDIGMGQRPFPWFDPTTYQSIYNQPMYNQAMYGGAFPGFQTNPYYAGVLPRPVFQVPHVPFSSEIANGMSPVGFPGFGVSGYLSPENFISATAKHLEIIFLLSSWSFCVRNCSAAAKLCGQLPLPLNMTTGT